MHVNHKDIYKILFQYIVICNDKNIIFVYENLEIYISLDYTSRIRYEIIISIGFLWGDVMPDDSFDRRSGRPNID